jgi:hypothetical protein
MSTNIRRVDYFYTTVKDQPGEAYKLLLTLTDMGVNLLAFTAVPVGPMQTQLALFPEDSGKLVGVARDAALSLDGPHRALLVQGENRIGAIVDVHMKLFEADVNVYASNGVTDGKCCFGYVLYVRPEQYEAAAQALGV